MWVISRYLLPPILNTMQSPTMLAVANEAFTSPQDCHETLLLLTCVCQARSGPSASSWVGDSQNCFRRALEMTRIHCSSYPQPGGIVVRKIRTVKAGVR